MEAEVGTAPAVATPDTATAQSTLATAQAQSTPDAAQVPPPPRLSAGLRRLAGISASLVGTQALTIVLGLAFWTLAARSFSLGDVGVAGAAVSMMMLLSSLGSLGLGTLLIARLPVTDQAQRRLLIRTCLLAAGVCSGLLTVIVPTVALYVFHAENLRPLAGSPLTLLGLAAGTALMSMVVVLDQAVLTVGVGLLQFERNVTASVVKIVALLGLGAAGYHGGMVIFMAWTIGNLVSMPLISWRSRGGRIFEANRRIADPRVLKGLGRLAASHHALNITIQAALQILPIMVTILLSARENAYFNTAIMVSGFVFALPYSVTIGLFAAARGDDREVISRMRLTIPFGLAVSAGADLVLFPLAHVVLGVFGKAYAADGAGILRVLVLAGLPFVVKDHFVALRRVQGRITEAVSVLCGFLVIELIGAAIGARVGGIIGLCVVWVGILFIEAIILSVPLVYAWVAFRKAPNPTDTVAAPALAEAVAFPVPASNSGLLNGTDTVALPTTADTLAAPSPAAWAGRAAQSGRGAWWRASRNLAGPALVLMSLGVLVMAFAADAGRNGNLTAWPKVGWVAGLILIFLPAVIRVVGRTTPSAERVILALALPVWLQVSRLVLNPTQFAYHDELIHANTLRQIGETSHLFSENPLLPVSGYYPGLEIVSNAIHQLTGLGLFQSGVVTLLLARLVIALAVIALVSWLTKSRRAGAVGAVVYAANPQMLFFNSQYSYQTLALPLAIFTVYAFATRARGRRSALILPLAGLAMVTLTHHVTALLLVAAFAAWFVGVAIMRRVKPARSSGVLGMPRPRSRVHRADLGGLALMTGVGAVLSLLAAINRGNPLRAYLEAIVSSSSTDVSSLEKGKATKALFADSAGTGPAWWEQILLISAVLITMVSMLIVLKFIRSRWRGVRVLGLVVGLLALLYPVIPAGHLTAATAEVGDRASGFVFIGIAAVIGWWSWRGRWRRRSLILFVGAALVVFLGDIVLGSGPTAGQLPGPYEISADARSIDSNNLAAARWLVTGVPPDSVVYGDRTSGLLAAADGGQFTVLHVSTNIDDSRLLLDPAFTQNDIDLIRKSKLDYLIVDLRLSQGLPHQQVYIESGEFGGADRTAPVPAGALEKFGSVLGVKRLYDNGSLVIYDVRGLR